MQDTQILSSPAAPPISAPAGDPTRHIDTATTLVFDACHLGVVLRAVLGVQTVVATAALFEQHSLGSWLQQLAWLTAGTLPATLGWLVAVCCLKRLLHGRPLAVHGAVGITLGALAGLYGCASMAFTGLLESPPWLASACSGAVLAAVMVAALVQRARATLPAATAARLEELQSRIRPHFLFNTLNSAIALVRDEPAKAEQVLADLSDLFRAALAPPQTLVTLKEELALAERYLAIEQIRFGDRLQLHWDLNPAAHHALLPPLLLQPLVENAVKYGVEASECGGNVTVTTKLSGHRCILQVTNTLCFTPAKRREVAVGQGIALANVQTRLVLLHDIQAEFSAHEVNGQFVVTLSVPDAPAILI